MAVNQNNEHLNNNQDGSENTILGDALREALANESQKPRVEAIETNPQSQVVSEEVTVVTEKAETVEDVAEPAVLTEEEQKLHQYRLEADRLLENLRKFTKPVVVDLTIQCIHDAAKIIRVFQREEDLHLVNNVLDACLAEHGEVLQSFHPEDYTKAFATRNCVRILLKMEPIFEQPRKSFQGEESVFAVTQDEEGSVFTLGNAIKAAGATALGVGVGAAVWFGLKHFGVIGSDE